MSRKSWEATPLDFITDTIAIGNYLDAQDADLLRTHGTRSALSLEPTLQK